jgi:hypothetical protein
MSEVQTVEATVTTEAQGEPEAQTVDATGTNGGEDRRFTQADIDAIVKDRLARAEEKAKKQQEKARADAEARTLAEQGEYKKLAEQAQAALQEYEPFKDRAERYELALTKLLKEERKSVPKWAQPLLDKLDPAEQLEYIAANRGEFARATPPNINDTPGADVNANGGPSDDELTRKAINLGLNPQAYIKSYRELNRSKRRQ